MTSVPVTILRRAGTESPTSSDLEQKLSRTSEERSLIHQPLDEQYEGRHRYDPAAQWSPEDEQRVKRKVDIRIMCWLCLVFFCLQLDRGNISYGERYLRWL